MVHKRLCLFVYFLLMIYLLICITSYRNEGITTIAVGIGDTSNEAELLHIAGNETRLLQVDDFDSLSGILNTLADMIMSAQNPCVEG